MGRPYAFTVQAQPRLRLHHQPDPPCAVARCGRAPATVGPLRAVSSDAAFPARRGRGPAAGLVPGRRRCRRALRPGNSGFQHAGEPGGAQVPVAATWDPGAPGHASVLSVVQESWQDAGGLPLALVPVPAAPGPTARAVANWWRSCCSPAARCRPACRSATPGWDALGRSTEPRGGAAARLGEVAWWRGRRVVALTVVPAVRHDGSAVARAVLEAGTWEVRFVPEKAVRNCPRPPAADSAPAGTTASPAAS